MSNDQPDYRLLLTGGSPDGGPVASLLVASGRVEALGTDADRRAEETAATRVDLSGYVLLPGAVEPHVHLDKALLAERSPNVAGGLRGAIDAAHAAYASMTAADVADRARRALATAVRHGYTLLRTHVDCGEGVDVTGLMTLLELRDRVRPIIELQVVAMAGFPVTGDDGAANLQLLFEALDAGADVVGGVPTLDADPAAAVSILVGTAARRGLPIDLHLDETLDPASLTVRDFAREVTEHGLAGRATASHCVSLGQLEAREADKIAAELAAAHVAVVMLPQTNLYLMGREFALRTPRGLTAVDALRRAGVVVCAGGDNWRDPFNPMSRIDPLETASLAVVAAHLSPAEAYDAVSVHARRALGMPPAGFTVGAEADFLAVRAASLTEAIADAGEDRVVIRAGRIVARSHVIMDVEPLI